MIRLLPALIFLGLCTLLTVSLWSDKTPKHSDVLGRSFPVIQGLKPLNNDTPVDSSNVRIINLFASWCVPCIVELPVLKEARDELNLPIIGIAWKDDENTLNQWLKSHGNPFDVIYNDHSGAFGIEVGIRGIPETFVVDKNNTILFHHRGPLMRSHLDEIQEVLVAQ